MITTQAKAKMDEMKRDMEQVFMRTAQKFQDNLKDLETKLEKTKKQIVAYGNHMIEEAQKKLKSVMAMFSDKRKGCEVDSQAMIVSASHKLATIRSSNRAKLGYYEAQIYAKGCRRHSVALEAFLQEKAGGKCTRECESDPKVQEVQQKWGDAMQQVQKQFEMGYDVWMKTLKQAMRTKEVAVETEIQAAVQKMSLRVVPILSKAKQIEHIELEKTKKFCHHVYDEATDAIQAKIADVKEEWKSGVAHLQEVASNFHQKCGTIAKARHATHHLKRVSHIAGAIEGQEARAEARATRSANKLGAAQETLAKDAARAERTAAAKFNKDSAEAARQVREAAEATAKAAQESDMFKKKMAAVEKQMAAETGAAKIASKKRLAVYKYKMMKANHMKNRELAKGKAIRRAQGALAVAHRKVLGHIQKAYAKHTAALSASAAKSDAKFKAEKAKIAGKFAKAMKGNAEAYATKKKLLKHEEKGNKAKFAVATKVINAKAAAAAKALADHNKKEAKVKKAVADAEKARRGAEAKVKADKAKEATKKYMKSMAEAGRKKAAAKVAEKAAESSNKKSVEEQKEADALATKTDKEDAAMVECATDGSECQKGGTCIKTNPDKGPYMAADGFSCSEVKQSYDGDWDDGGGLAIAGIAPEAAPLEPLKAKDQGKCDALKKGAVKLFKAAIDQEASAPILYTACAEGYTHGERYSAMMEAFDYAAACKPFCYPGTETYTPDHVQDTWGICLDPASIEMGKANIEDMPNYKPSGTGGRFAAGPKSDICRMAKNLICGMAAGAAEGFCVSQPKPKPVLHRL
jgi:hypothetical protein